MSACTAVFRAVLAIFNIILIALLGVIHFYSQRQEKFIFHYILQNRTASQVSDTFFVTMRPQSWMEYVWYGIYGWQLLWMIQAIAIQFRKFPAVLNSFVFLLFLSSTILTATWVVFLNRLMVTAACIVLFSAVFLTALALVLIYVRFNEYYDPEEHPACYFWGFQVLVFNGIACYVVWLIYHAMLILAAVLTYREDITEPTSTTVVLILMYVLVLVWFILENTVFLWSTRYTFSIYPTLVTAQVASALGNWDPRMRNSIILVMLIAMVCVIFVFRVVRVAVRLKRSRKTYSTQVPPPPPPPSQPQEPLKDYKLEVLSTKF